MNKSNLIKLFSILLISIMVIMFTSNVLAATDTDDFSDLTNTLNNTNNTNTNSSNTNTNDTNTNVNTNKTNTNTNSSNVNKSNNTSIYNNTNLPKTGIEDSIPVAILVVIFGISSIYAYKKIKEYKNI